MTSYLFPNKFLSYRHFLLGVSGGLDSTVLLHRFMLWRNHNQNITLRAVHVHHGLSLNADIWEKHCRMICREWKIPLVVIRVLFSKKNNGTESQARKSRYTAFKNTLLPDEMLVTAHHLNDQCETFFLALKRGSGPTGLSAMPKCINFFSTKLLRPLLNETRESLIDWAQKYTLRWIEDEDNQNDYHDRNFLRLRIMPLLSKRWPHILSTVSRSATLCADQENLLDELLNDELETLVSSKKTIEIAPLTVMSSSHRFALLRRWLLKQGALMPSFSVLDQIWKTVAQARRDAKPCICFNGYEIRRFKGFLWRIKSYPINKNTVFSWYNLKEPFILPYEMGWVSLEKGKGNIRFPLFKESVSIRFKAEGMLSIVGRHGRRKLKKIWQELNIPPWERFSIPLLFYNEKLIAAAGKFITKEGWIKDGMCFEHKKLNIKEEHKNKSTRWNNS